MIEKLHEINKQGFLISTDPKRLQMDKILGFLSRSYWANDRPAEAITRSIENSLCFGLYRGNEQVGFARAVTDYTTYAWLCDVFIQENYRGQGLGKWLISCVMGHPELANLRRWALATSNAHELYRKFGFSEVKNPDKLMEFFHLNPYGIQSR
jgi:GNAT superfamily N-acetyltransferase